jgi:hypothetical protein
LLQLHLHLLLVFEPEHPFLLLVELGGQAVVLLAEGLEVLVLTGEHCTDGNERRNKYKQTKTN